MKLKKKHSLIPIFSSQMTAMISVALVLYILGIIALTGLVTHRLTESIRQQVGFVAVFSDKASEADINAVKKWLGAAEAIADYRYASADEVMTRWQNDMGADLDLDEILLGVNPFAPEVEVNMRASHASPDSLDAVASRVGKFAGVDHVTVNLDTAREVGRSLDSIMIVMGLIAGALLVISFVLINNTIRLSIYARRFQIHTMKLVGATAGFIRRPFVGRNVVSGILAALLASMALVASAGYAGHLEPSTLSAVTTADMAIVVAGLFAAGVTICALAALFATNRYIRISYDRMFK